MTKAYETIRTEEKLEGAVLEIRLATPPANILTEKMIGEIGDCLERDRSNPDRKAVVFSADGKHFSFGASVEEHQPGQVDRMLPAFHGLMIRIFEHPVPTVSRVSGLCLGGAFELVLCTSFVFAEEGSQFAVPEIQLGVFPPVAAALVESCGAPALLTEMIVTGEKFPARALLERGIVSRVVPAGTGEASVMEWVQKQLLPKSASSLRIAHRAARTGLAERFAGRVRQLEDVYLGSLMKTADAREGIEAFVAKRPARWKNS